MIPVAATRMSGAGWEKIINAIKEENSLCMD